MTSYPTCRRAMNRASPSSGSVDDWVESPVLLHGGRKAGTTLLVSLLDGGPELLVYPNEVKLKRLLRRRWQNASHMVADYLSNVSDPLKAPFRSEAVPPGPHRPPVRWEPRRVGRARALPGVRVRVGNLAPDDAALLFDQAAYLSALERLVEAPPPSLGPLLTADAAAFASSIRATAPSGRWSGWAFKEVGGDPRSLYAGFHEMFPKGRIVVIVRDPRRIVRSILTDRRRRRIKVDPAYVVRQAMVAHRHIAAYQTFVQDKRLHFVIYERLVGGRLEEELRECCAFLGIEFDAVHTRPTTLGRPSRVRTASQETDRVFDANREAWWADLSWTETTGIGLVAEMMRFAARGKDSYTTLLEMIDHERQVKEVDV